MRRRMLSGVSGGGSFFLKAASTAVGGAISFSIPSSPALTSATALDAFCLVDSVAMMACLNLASSSSRQIIVADTHHCRAKKEQPQITRLRLLVIGKECCHVMPALSCQPRLGPFGFPGKCNQGANYRNTGKVYCWRSALKICTT